MGKIWEFLKGELLEIIEWTNADRDVICWRFPDEDKAIKRGAQLIVRESQVAQFLYLGEFGDTFLPGKHTLVTDNIPVLTRLKSWKFGLESPFKADVYFVNSRLFTGNKWGTSNPIMMRDEDFGIVRARAFGTYDFRILDPKLFIKEVAGADHDFRTHEFEDTMRSRVVSVFSEAIASAKIPVLDVASRYTELGEALLPIINPVVGVKYGIEISTFVVENVSVPEEVEKAIDKRSSMAAVGNLNDFVKYQLGQGLESGGGSPAGMATEMAIGLAIAQQLVQQQGLPGAGAGIAGGALAGGTGAGGAGSAAAGAAGGQQGGAAGAAAGAPGGATAGSGGGSASTLLPDLLTPEDVANALGVSVQDVNAILESGELKAKKIGTSYRIKRSALDEYLAS